MTTEQANPTVRVNVIARLVPALAYLIVLVSGGASAVLLKRVLAAITHAESSGIGAVAQGISQADLVIQLGLFLAIIVTVIGILLMVLRAFTPTKTANPSAWFFVITGSLSLIPMLLVWKSEAALIAPLIGSASFSEPSIQRWLMLAQIFSVVLILLTLVLSVVQAPRFLRAKRKLGPVVALVLIELALIGMAVIFQMRGSWMYQGRLKGF